jgi:alkanesulfonate monooxygenase SsuD/methylene tetrahydromethanopterin reductase-like flavin-dependent oxidoreductase (luciferase family)
MAKIGRPVLIGVQTVETLRHRLDLYRETMHDAKYSDSQVEHALDETWVQRGLVVAESDQEAQDIAGPALDRYRKHLLDARINYNISEVPAVDPSQPRPPGEVVEQAFLAGTPRRVAELVDELKDIGARNVMLNANVGQIEPQHVERTLRLFGEQVIPKFKDA